LPPSSLGPLAPPRAVAPFDAKKAKEHQAAWAKHLGVEPEITNSIGMKLRLIPPGEFMMGTDQEQIAVLRKQIGDGEGAAAWLACLECEAPAHSVRLTDPS